MKDHLVQGPFDELFARSVLLGKEVALMIALSFLFVKPREAGHIF